MFGIGWTELLVVGALALMLLGEEKFPDFVKIAIRAVRDFRRYWDEVKHEVEREVRKPLERELKPLTREIQNLTRVDPETYIRSISPNTPPDNKTAEIATSPDMGTPPETLGNAAETPGNSAETPANAAETPARAPDEPAGSVNAADAAVMQAGLTPYKGGGLGARPEPAPQAEIAPAGDTPVTETPPREELPAPPSRLD